MLHGPEEPAKTHLSLRIFEYRMAPIGNYPFGFSNA